MERDVADLKIDDPKPFFKIYTRNGLQGITYESYYVKNDKLSELIISSMKDLKELVNPINPIGYKERYAQDLEKNYPLKYWNMGLSEA